MNFAELLSKMDRLLVVFSAILQVFSLPQGYGFPQHYDSHTTESVSIFPSTTPWMGRSASHMPEELKVNIVRRHKQALDLTLKRWDYHNSRVPVYRLNNGQLEYTPLPDTSSTASLYQGAHDNDLFLVQAAANNSKSKFSLLGVFWDAGKQLELAPLTVANAEVAYSIKQMEELKYADDMLYPPSSANITKKTKPRRRRQAQGVRYIELAVFTDYQLYQRFLKFADNNAEKAKSEISQYYKYVVASMDRRYQSITKFHPKLTVRVIMASLTICDDPSECKWSKDNVMSSTEKIVYTNSLSQFRDFVLNSGSPKGDHKMFFTGYQMAKPDGTVGNIGILSMFVTGCFVDVLYYAAIRYKIRSISYVGSMCTDWSVSMIQERYSGATAGVAAHELGHSLGAFHDDNKAYIGCSNQNYVMNSYASFPTASDVASRPYYFSNCSANSIVEYLKGSKGSCTNNQPGSTDSQSTPAGQHFNADAQCVIYNGAGSKFCRKEQKKRGFANMCTRMACTLPKNQNSCSEIVPLDRTSCGDGQWCVDNICVKDAKAPKKRKDCPQGDDPTAGCASNKCKGDSDSQALCCETCSK